MAKKKKFHVCLVNFTDKGISYAQELIDIDKAIYCIVKYLEPQAALNNQADGKDWRSYGPADEPFTFPKE